MTIRAAVYHVLDEYPPGRLSGWDLFDLVVAKRGGRPYPHRLLQYAREWADESGGGFECVDHQRSIYRVEKGFAIAGAIHD